MDIQNAKKEFTKYANNYDLESEKMKRKYEHSFRVMEKAGKIAEYLKLPKQDIELAILIGLLHDIGRFEQIRIYNSFEDHQTIDHGDLGVQILRESNYIRKYIEDDKYDDIILKSIKNHNKFKIEDGLSDRELLFSKIVRDADKWDIFYEGAEMFWNTEKERQEVENTIVTEEIWKQFKEKSLIDRTMTKTSADKILNFIALIYDINFDYTYKNIKEADYINKVLNKFNFKDKKTAKIMEEVRKI